MWCPIASPSCALTGSKLLTPQWHNEGNKICIFSVFVVKGKLEPPGPPLEIVKVVLAALVMNVAVDMAHVLVGVFP